MEIRTGQAVIDESTLSDDEWFYASNATDDATKSDAKDVFFNAGNAESFAICETSLS